MFTIIAIIESQQAAPQLQAASTVTTLTTPTTVEPEATIQQVHLDYYCFLIVWFI